MFLFYCTRKNTRGPRKMGYAIFAARKLMLTNRLSQIRFRILALSQQKMTLSQAAGDKQRAYSMLKNNFDQFGNQYVNIFGKQHSDALSQLNNKNLSEEQREFYQQILQNSFGTMKSITDSIFNQNQYIDLQASYDLKNINNIENQIDLEMKTLETQEKAMTAELQEVEKKEDSEIKNSAPKFA